jgi:hypothetical protein
MNTRYTYDSENLVYEVLNNEVVIVNLESGYYYILEGTAAEIWQAIVGGANVGETGELLLTIFEGDSTQVHEAVGAFVDDLLLENLISVQDESASTLEEAYSPSKSPSSKKKNFYNPTMIKYTDMEYLLKMDPIREYDDGGWPKRRTFAPNDQK